MLENFNSSLSLASPLIYVLDYLAPRCIDGDYTISLLIGKWSKAVKEPQHTHLHWLLQEEKILVCNMKFFPIASFFEI